VRVAANGVKRTNDPSARSASHVTGVTTRTAASVSDTCKPVKLRPHQQQCQSNIVECYKSNDFFDKVECCFDTAAVFDNNVERKLVLLTRSKQIEYV